MISHQNVFKLNKTIAVVISILCFSFSLGCARTASSKATILNLEILVTFRGDVEPNNYFYYLLLSGTQTPRVPTWSSEMVNVDYMPAPGRSYDEQNPFIAFNGGVNYYYQNYFQTWSDYIILDRSGHEVYTSEAAGFSSTTTGNEHYNYAPDMNFDEHCTVINGNTIKFVFEPQKLSNYVNQKVYFNVLATRRRQYLPPALLTADEDDSGAYCDVLQSTVADAVITIKAGNEVDIKTDAEDSQITAPSDIISWEARVY